MKSRRDRIKLHVGESLAVNPALELNAELFLSSGLLIRLLVR